MPSSTTGSDTGFLSRVKRTTQTMNATCRPWSDFLDLSAFNLPLSLSDATTRITQNLTHFRSNYAVITLLILFLGLIYHPVSIIVFLLTLVAWFFFYFARDRTRVSGRRPGRDRCAVCRDGDWLGLDACVG